ncbi:type II toxin-antitoxin system HicA family toxin [Candidatus Peregrinibacteria bacterium]|nr:type II toxin-antitoxin system HicA family toxin [Candidatus Peregrinibacteria bacterium]
MPKLYSSSRITRVLRRHGFSLVGQKGSHAKFRQAGKRERNVIVPMNRREIPCGTFHSILRQCGLKEADFKR